MDALTRSINQKQAELRNEVTTINTIRNSLKISDQKQKQLAQKCIDLEIQITQLKQQHKTLKQGYEKERNDICMLQKQLKSHELKQKELVRHITNLKHILDEKKKLPSSSTKSFRY